MQHVSDFTIRLNIFKTIAETEFYLLQQLEKGTLPKNSFVVFLKQESTFYREENGICVFSSIKEATETINTLIQAKEIDTYEY